MIEKRYWIHSVTPLHLGAGRGLGYIDLPVAREKVTNWPFIPGSSVKGVIADHFGADDSSRKKDKTLKAAFGIAGDESSSSSSTAGSLVFTDAHLLLLPVRSFYGAFAWITSPFALERFCRDMPDIKLTVAAPEKDENVLLATGSVLAEQNKIYLEDLDLSASEDKAVAELAEVIGKALFAQEPEWQKILKQRLAVVSDNIFTFLCESGTEVSPHIRIDDTTGVVAKGALWYEEALPVETVLTGKVWCDKVYKSSEEAAVESSALFEKYCTAELSLQLGGKASTGKGLVRCVFEPIGK